MKLLRTLARSTFILGCAVAACGPANAGGGATDFDSYGDIEVDPVSPRQ